jgi:2-polyprenyl-6-methoxyphenol hydroxylase-like FAD-dependent oxidoreductase
MSNPIDHSCGVLIVGAGPSGLMLACQLQRFGISYRIVEKNSGPTTQSRALAIQARSLSSHGPQTVWHRQHRVCATWQYRAPLPAQSAGHYASAYGGD